MPVAERQPDDRRPAAAGEGGAARLHVVTPVKDSIDLTLQTAAAVLVSRTAEPFLYTIYNDFSTPENTALLERKSREMGFRLVNLADLTDTPSPNYLVTLRTAQREAVEAGASLLIVESDVVVDPDTVRRLVEGAAERPRCALAAAVTVDERGEVNYPYLRMKGRRGVVEESKHLSFCCTLLTHAFLSAVDFAALDPAKQWFDVSISHMALRADFSNYVFCDVRVLHRPHGSRPWKMLKYSSRLKYYWQKFLKGRDKI